MARKRLSVFDYETIIGLFRQGQSARDIARKGLAGRRKLNEIRAAAESLEWLDPLKGMPSKDLLMSVLDKGSPVPLVPSKVEPYRQTVQKLLEDGHQPQNIFDYLSRHSKFQGSVGAVKRFCRRLTPPATTGFVVVNYLPGEAAQVDFGSGPALVDPVSGKTRKTHVFIMTLCFSRHQYAELVWDQSVETWLRCHRNAFQFFGGVPHKIIIDNLKAAITKACATDPVVQRSYEEYARGYGFQIAPCRPRTPWHKGRVEAGVKFFKSSFLPLREYKPGLLDGNTQLMDWVMAVGNRVHGTTKQVPLEVFTDTERTSLKSLPFNPPEVVSWAIAKLHDNCHFNLEGSYYSSPYSLINEKLDIRVGERMVEVYLGTLRVALHVRAITRGTFRTNDAHYPPEKRAYLQKTSTWCLSQAEAIGPKCSEFVETLLADKVVDRLPSIRRLLGLVEKFGGARVELACGKAISYGALEYPSVRNMLQRNLEQVTPPVPIHTGFISSPRFGRDIGQLLACAGGGRSWNR